MVTVRSSPRKFRSRERYQLALSDVYDGYAAADLALWLPAPSGSLHLSGSALESPARIVAAWLSEGGEVESGWVFPEEFKTWLTNEAGRVGAVVEIANPNKEAVRDATAVLGYSPEVMGQVTGYWFEEDDVPATKPTYDSDGALLILPESGNGNGRRALDLVRIGYEWRVLSHAAVLTYIHTTGIRRGERWVLATYGTDASISRRFLATSIEEFAVAEVAKLGGHVAGRARDDYPAVLLRITES